MEGRIEQLLLQLQKELENADVQCNNVSTMARIGNSKLVRAFFNESITLKLPSSVPRDDLHTGMDMLQSYIYTCCFWGCQDTLKKIIDMANLHGLSVDVNAQNHTTLWTPLHAATFQEHGPVIMLLLDSGANPHSVDAEGWTPVDYASVSDKIWPHFASRGIQRISWQALLDKGLITHCPELGGRSASGSRCALARGIELADYDRPPSSASSNYSSVAAANGDVLADDNSSMSSAGPARNGYRLQNNIY